MPVFTRLIQTATSPEKSLKALSAPAKYNQSTFARLADVNDLAKDQNDQALYTLSVNGTTGTQAITTKRGVVKVTNASSSSQATFTLTLTNSELVAADVDKYFIHATVASATTMAPTITVVPVTAGQFQIIVTCTSAINWSTNPTYINYTITKIGD